MDEGRVFEDGLRHRVEPDLSGRKWDVGNAPAVAVVVDLDPHVPGADDLRAAAERSEERNEGDQQQQGLNAGARALVFVQRRRLDLETAVDRPPEDEGGKHFEDHDADADADSHIAGLTRQRKRIVGEQQERECEKHQPSNFKSRYGSHSERPFCLSDGAAC